MVRAVLYTSYVGNDKSAKVSQEAVTISTFSNLYFQKRRKLANYNLKTHSSGLSWGIRHHSGVYPITGVFNYQEPSVSWPTQAWCNALHLLPTLLESTYSFTLIHIVNHTVFHNVKLGRFHIVADSLHTKVHSVDNRKRKEHTHSQCAPQC